MMIENLIPVILIPNKPMFIFGKLEFVLERDFFFFIGHCSTLIWPKSYRGPDLGDLIAGYGPDCAPP